MSCGNVISVYIFRALSSRFFICERQRNSYIKTCTYVSAYYINFHIIKLILQTEGLFQHWFPVPFTWRNHQWSVLFDKLGNPWFNPLTCQSLICVTKLRGNRPRRCGCPSISPSCKRSHVNILDKNINQNIHSRSIGKTKSDHNKILGFKVK